MIKDTAFRLLVSWLLSLFWLALENFSIAEVQSSGAHLLIIIYALLADMS